MENDKDADPNVADRSPSHGNPSQESVGGWPTGMILTVADPDSVFDQAIRSGATEIHSAGEIGYELKKR
jgi:hypothetical protein